MAGNGTSPFQLFLQISELIDFSSNLAKNAYTFIGRYRETTQDYRDIGEEVQHLVTDLYTLKGFLEAPTDEGRCERLSQLRDTLSTCWKIVGRLNKLMGHDNGHQSGQDAFSGNLEAGQQQQPDPAWRDKLNWPRVKDEALALLQQLKTQRQNIMIFLQIGVTQGVQALKIDTSIMKIQMSSTNKAVHDVLGQMTELREYRRWWATIIDEIKAMHRDKRSLQEPKTCKWITMVQPWTNWLQGVSESDASTSARFCWIWGIPGSGKTVMASFLIDQVANEKGPRYCSYYYCLHSRGKDEAEDFLRCVVKDFQQKTGHIPEVLHKRFTEVVRPSEDDLLESLNHLAKRLKRIYIIVDAIDESSERVHIARVLHKLGTCPSFWRISLLVTSRNEADIRAIFNRQSYLCTEIPMSGAGVKEDMGRLAHSELGKMQDWSDTITARVEGALVERAQGMFRWLVCQLDLVKRLYQQGVREEADILREIRAFPQDLFGTYERILTQIRGEDREFARTALALICNPGTHIPSAEILVEASLYKIEFGKIGNYDVGLLKNVCSCLVTVTRRKYKRQTNRVFQWTEELDHKAALADYTVKEYLFSQHAAEGAASCYALSQEFLRIVDLMVFFRGLKRFGIRAQAGEQRGKTRVHPYDEFALIVTENALSRRRSQLMDNDELLELVLSSLKPTSQHFTHLKQLNGIKTAMRNNFPLWEKLLFGVEVRPTSPCMDYIGVLLNLMLIGWPEMAKKYLESSEIVNLGRGKDAIWTDSFRLQNEAREILLGYVVRTRDRAFLDLFLKHGAFFEYESEVLFSLLHNLYVRGDDRDGTLDLVREVLRHGAEPNPKPSRSRVQSSESEDHPLPDHFAFTPLQVAVACLESDWVKILLEAGADPYGCGMKGGLVPKAFEGFVRDNAEGGGTKMLKDGTMKPLELCGLTKPPWSTGNDKPQVNTARRQVRQALENWLKRGPDEANSPSGTATDSSGGTVYNPHVLY
ncbi:hypothetical protein PG996_008579 [Apiospora saccharicola]|uniref:Nephrocystin 3-like N-terminal domain-containing protein n=1 Tax=Apiospora saccharicola TaxID=335842 RepID=A0ABR1UYC1_9PEZI